MTSDFSNKTPAMLYGQGDRLALLRRLLNRLGNPDQAYRIIHIAGTNGKGSTANMIACILAEYDLRVGLFTSPHLFSECESIQVNQKMIDKMAFNRLLDQVYQAAIIEGLNPEVDLSQFELSFLVATLYYAHLACDWVVFECGMGGALDATNAITSSDYAVFTKIGLDHLNILGHNLSEITRTKSGIMRPNQTVIVAPNQKQEAIDILREKSEQLACHWVYSPKPLADIQPDRRYLVRLADDCTLQVSLGLQGDYQVENLTTACLWYQAWLQEEGLLVDEKRVNQALRGLSLPGRYETVSQSPLIILDACHNMDAMEATIDTLKQEFKDQKIYIICGFLKDKDVNSMVKLLKELKADFILTQPDFPGRTLEVEDLAVIFDKEGISTLQFKSPLEAVNYALNEKLQPLIILGSFHLIKCVRMELLSDA
ncbi:bifunctional folylpolyglutamate synthase/dihydrofolate synthase [Facklamia hominis]